MTIESTYFLEPEERTEPLLVEEAGAPTVAEAALRARDYLWGIQAPDGHWCAELEGDTILESEYVLTMTFLGRGASERVLKAAAYLRKKQLATGGWAIYEGGPAEISASVKAYFVLKLIGDDPESTHMRAARERILELGGIEACNSFTLIYLAIFGQVPWSRCPAVIPEMLLQPRWSPFNLYQMSSWSRAIVVPLSIIWAHRPACSVPEHCSLAELWVGRRGPLNSVVRLLGRPNFWTLFFTGADQYFKVRERIPWKPLRARALARAEAWITERLEMSDGLGAIFPPIINTIIAFRCLGYPMDHPLLERQIAELERLTIEEDETLRVQPCLSPVWDTALALGAQLDAGVPDTDPRIAAATRWLVRHEVRHPGDWCHRVGEVTPSGWYFEYANEFYPDCDDTAEVLGVLGRITLENPEDEARRRAAVERGRDWLLGMQNEDGGWAAFDRGCDRKLLTYVPFADHNAMIDPSCEDITGRALEALRILGLPHEHPAVARADAWLRDRQERDGAWYGRWGCNYVYGTWLAVSGLAAYAEDPARDPAIQRGAAWLGQHQNPDGGWGESPRSYDEPELRGIGPSTAAQTAWGLLGLLAAGRGPTDAGVERAVAWLQRNQLPDGSWYDAPWTGTGFPRVFYLRYHLYATYFPAQALASWSRRAREG